MSRLETYFARWRTNAFMVEESTVTGKDFLENDDNETKEGEAITLLPGLVSLSFEYFVVKHDQDGKREEESWVSAWS